VPCPRRRICGDFIAPGGGAKGFSLFLTTDYTDFTDFSRLGFCRTTRWEERIRSTRATWGDEIGSQTPNSMRVRSDRLG
jgi:hypothetical protein